jgi:hypothetical protein
MVKKPGKENPVALDAACLSLIAASQEDFNAATKALQDKKQQDFVDVCTSLGISKVKAHVLYKALKEAVNDADWGWQ